MCLWYCQEGAAGVEFRQLQSSQGIVSAWALAAPELDADETLSPKPLMHWPRRCREKTPPSTLHPPPSSSFLPSSSSTPSLFPQQQQQTPYWTLPLPFTSFRPSTALSPSLSPSFSLPLSGPHIAILVLYIGAVEYCTQSLFIHSHCTIIDNYSDIVRQAPVHRRAPNIMWQVGPSSWETCEELFLLGVQNRPI